MKKQRPIHLDLQTIRFPATAIASILHRISGVIMIFGIGILLWLFNTSLTSPQGFAEIQTLFDGFLIKLVSWGILVALIYHLIGGLRHLVMDTGRWEELQSGISSAKAVFMITTVCALIAGVWIW